MIRPLLVVLTLLAVSLLGCNSDDSPLTIPAEPVHTPTVIPLAVGNKWVRSFSLYDTSGVVFSSGVDSIEVLRDSLVRGIKYYVLKMQGLEHLVANRSNGLCWLTNFGEALWYKFPATPRDSFFVYGNTSYVRIPTVDTSIIVPRGTFSCYRYELDGPASVGAIGGYHEIEFLSPDNGFIKLEFYSSTYTSATHFLYSRIELIKLTIK